MRTASRAMNIMASMWFWEDDRVYGKDTKETTAGVNSNQDKFNHVEESRSPSLHSCIPACGLDLTNSSPLGLSYSLKLSHPPPIGNKTLLRRERERAHSNGLVCRSYLQVATSCQPHDWRPNLGEKIVRALHYYYVKRARNTC